MAPWTKTIYVKELQGNEMTLLSVLGNNNVILFSGKSRSLLMISLSTWVSHVCQSVSVWTNELWNLGRFWFSGW